MSMYIKYAGIAIDRGCITQEASDAGGQGLQPQSPLDFLQELGTCPRPDPIKHSLQVWISNLNFQTWVPEILSSFWVEPRFTPWEIMHLPSARLKFPIT